MYQIKNRQTGEFGEMITKNPYPLKGEYLARKMEQRTDAEGNLLYLTGAEERVPTMQKVFVDGELVEQQVEINGEPQTHLAPVTTTLTGYTATIKNLNGEDEQLSITYAPAMQDAGPLYEWVEVIPTPAEIASKIQTELTNAVQAHLDNTAKMKGYDGILSAASYAALPVGEPFQAEGTQYALWRSAVWVRCYEVLGEVQAGTRPIPTVDELLAELPAIEL